jgi:hypothetical protein
MVNNGNVVETADATDLCGGLGPAAHVLFWHHDERCFRTWNSSDFDSSVHGEA